MSFNARPFLKLAARAGTDEKNVCIVASPVFKNLDTAKVIDTQRRLNKQIILCQAPMNLQQAMIVQNALSMGSLQNAISKNDAFADVKFI